MISISLLLKKSIKDVKYKLSFEMTFVPLSLPSVFDLSNERGLGMY